MMSTTSPEQASRLLGQALSDAQLHADIEERYLSGLREALFESRGGDGPQHARAAETLTRHPGLSPPRAWPAAFGPEPRTPEYRLSLRRTSLAMSPDRVSLSLASLLSSPGTLTGPRTPHVGSAVSTRASHAPATRAAREAASPEDSDDGGAGVGEGGAEGQVVGGLSGQRDSPSPPGGVEGAGMQRVVGGEAPGCEAGPVARREPEGLASTSQAPWPDATAHPGTARGSAAALQALRRPPPAPGRPSSLLLRSLSGSLLRAPPPRLTVSDDGESGEDGGQSGRASPRAGLWLVPMQGPGRRQERRQWAKERPQDMAQAQSGEVNSHPGRSDGQSAATGPPRPIAAPSAAPVKAAGEVERTVNHTAAAFFARPGRAAGAEEGSVTSTVRPAEGPLRLTQTQWDGPSRPLQPSPGASGTPTVAHAAVEAEGPGGHGSPGHGAWTGPEGHPMPTRKGRGGWAGNGASSEAACQTEGAFPAGEEKSGNEASSRVPVSEREGWAGWDRGPAGSLSGQGPWPWVPGPGWASHTGVAHWPGAVARGAEPWPVVTVSIPLPVLGAPAMPAVAFTAPPQVSVSTAGGVARTAVGESPEAVQETPLSTATPQGATPSVADTPAPPGSALQSQLQSQQGSNAYRVGSGVLLKSLGPEEVSGAGRGVYRVSALRGVGGVDDGAGAGEADEAIVKRRGRRGVAVRAGRGGRAKGRGGGVKGGRGRDAGPGEASQTGAEASVVRERDVSADDRIRGAGGASEGVAAGPAAVAEGGGVVGVESREVNRTGANSGAAEATEGPRRSPGTGADDALPKVEGAGDDCLGRVTRTLSSSAINDAGTGGGVEESTSRAQGGAVVVASDPRPASARGTRSASSPVRRLTWEAAVADGVAQDTETDAAGAEVSACAECGGGEGAAASAAVDDECDSPRGCASASQGARPRPAPVPRSAPSAALGRPRVSRGSHRARNAASVRHSQSSGNLAALDPESERLQRAAAYRARRAQQAAQSLESMLRFAMSRAQAEGRGDTALRGHHRQAARRACLCPPRQDRQPVAALSAVTVGSQPGSGAQEDSRRAPWLMRSLDDGPSPAMLALNSEERAAVVEEVYAIARAVRDLAANARTSDERAAAKQLAEKLEELEWETRVGRMRRSGPL